MTSKGSLEKKRRFSPLLHEILWTVRRYWWLALTGMVGFLFLTFVCQKFGGNRTEIFSLFIEDTEILIRVFAVLFGLLVAYVLFGFLWKKRESGLYLTVGVSRPKQFLIRYLFGFATVCLSVVLPLVFTYYQELATFGKDTYGLCFHYSAVYTVCLLTVTLLSYTVSVLVAILCGRFLSGLLCGVGVLAAPYTVVLAIQQMLGTYLFGTPLGARSDAPYIEEIPNFFARSGHAGLFTLLSDKLAHFELYASLIPSESVLETYKAERAWPILGLILLANLILALAALAGLAYCKRPAEVSGKGYIHPVLSHLVALSVAVGVGSLLLNLTIPVGGVWGTVLSTALFLVGSAVIAALLLLILMQEPKRLLRSLPAIGGSMAVCLVTVLCLGTGWFGYADYVPAVEDVQSVTVSYNQNAMLAHPHGHSSFIMGAPMSNGSRYENITTSVDEYGHYYCGGFQIHYGDLPVVTDSADIKAVLTIHEAILADGRRVYTGEQAAVYGETVVPADYYIIYTLKNGKTVTRYYRYLTLSTLETTLSVEDTDTYRSDFATLHQTADRSEMTVMQAGDPLFASFTDLDLTDDERLALYAALDADYAALDAEDRYQVAAEDVIGIIREQSTQQYYSQRIGIHPSNTDSETYYITAAYQHTLAFLEERGLTHCFESSYTVKSVEIQPYEVRFDMAQRAISHLFFSCDNTVQLDTTLPVTTVPEAEWSTYLENSLTVALLTRPGKLVQITLVNADGEEKLVTRYLYDEPVAAN